jgi:hypothetical protein
MLACTQRRALLLEVAFGSPERSLRAWESVRDQLDLSVNPIPDQDLLNLVAHRLLELQIDDVRMPVLTGLIRRTWYANQLLLSRSQVIDSKAQATSGASCLVTGRTATVLGYVASSGLLEIDSVEVVNAPGRVELSNTRQASFSDTRIRVPLPASHFVEMARRGCVVDAIAAAVDPDMNWAMVASESRRRHLRAPTANAIQLTLRVADVNLDAEIQERLGCSAVVRLFERTGHKGAAWLGAARRRFRL